MKLTQARRQPRADYTDDVPPRTFKHDLNDSAGWLFVATQERMQEYIAAPVYDMTTVADCMDYLMSQHRVLELIDNQLREG